MIIFIYTNDSEGIIMKSIKKWVKAYWNDLWMVEIKLSRNKDKIDEIELGRLEIGHVCTQTR